MRRAFANQVDPDGEHHDDRHVQAHVHEVLIKLCVGHVGKMGKFRTGGEDSPRASDNADGQIGFEVEDFRLQKPEDGSEQLEQNDNEQQVV